MNPDGNQSKLPQELCKIAYWQWDGLDLIKQIKHKIQKNNKESQNKL